MPSRRNTLRVIAVVGLLSAAFLIALPWLSCVTAPAVRVFTYPRDDFCFHDLRHTCATLLLEEGAHPRVVAERLGHSTPALVMNT